jgi:hypothetical protein
VSKYPTGHRGIFYKDPGGTTSRSEMICHNSQDFYTTFTIYSHLSVNIVSRVTSCSNMKKKGGEKDMRKLSKSLVMGLLLAVMALATVGGTVGGVVLAQDDVVPPQQQGWCHGSDGVCPYGITFDGSDGVCPCGSTTEARANRGCGGCHGAPSNIQTPTQ